MSWLATAWPWLSAMGVLVLLSALFSGSEAALFSLTPRGQRRLARSGASGRIAHGLLQDPDRLLSAILFWNLLINMTYFAIAAIIGSRLEASPDFGRSAAIAFTTMTLLVIIFFSEMLPKSVAVLVPVRLSVIVGPPLNLAVRLVSPILPLVNTTNQVASRLIWPSFQPETDIDLHDIERAIELGTHDAALQQRDRAALQGLIEMAETRVAELMRPRSKLALHTSPLDPSVVLAEPSPGGYLLVTDLEQKQVTSAIGVRHLRPSQMDDLKSAGERVMHVPWSALVSQVWDQLNQEEINVAVVVNEFGEFVGAVSVDDILKRVLAPRQGNDDAALGSDAIQQLGADQYRVAGSASLRGLAKRLGIAAPDETIATVAGYVQRQNERLPRIGDSALLGGYELIIVDQADEVTWIDVHPHAENAAEQDE